MECEDVNDELFCLRMELNQLSDLLIRGQSERWIHNFNLDHTEKEHLKRYEWVSKYVENLKVLDIACGSGYGSYILASKGNAKNILGCDLDKNALKYASFRNKHSNIEYKFSNAETFDEKDFDCVISFETVEHLVDFDSFLKNVNKAMKQDGKFYVSTPIASKAYDDAPSNIFHNQEWGFESFQSLILKNFRIENIYVQLYPFYYFSKGFRYRDLLKIRNNPSFTKFKILFKFLLQKLKLRKTDKIEFGNPELWDQKKYPKNIMGDLYIGLQIIECKK